jgi:hypothetical protein
MKDIILEREYCRLADCKRMRRFREKLLGCEINYFWGSSMDALNYLWRNPMNVLNNSREVI